MSVYKPLLTNAGSANERMDALCEFIEFWLGPRLDEYGEPADEVKSFSLPLPLRKLYEFAGRWPGFDKRLESKFAVGAFACQDSLRPLHCLEMSEEKRIKFIDENQGCWVCLTLTDGDDPPVWCDGDLWDDDGEPVRGEKKVCESLSKFLVTFILQEITLGSRMSLFDDGLENLFSSDLSASQPIWENGPYVHGNDASFFLWNDVLVANLWGGFHFGANHKAGIEFLKQHQGPVQKLGVMAGLPWRMDIRRDGSANVRYNSWPVEEMAELPENTFPFDDTRDEFLKCVSEAGHADRNPIVFFYRQGQSSTQGHNYHDVGIVTALFAKAIDETRNVNPALAKLFDEGWPFK